MQPASLLFEYSTNTLFPVLSSETSTMSPPTILRTPEAAINPSPVKSGGIKEMEIDSYPHAKDMTATTGLKRKATSLASTPSKVARFAPDTPVPELHGKDRGVDVPVQEDGNVADSNTSRNHSECIPPLPTPDPVEPKNTVALDIQADDSPLADTTSEVSSLKVASSNPSELVEHLTSSVEVASLSAPNTTEGQLGDDQDTQSVGVDLTTTEKNPSSSTQPVRSRMAPRPKHSLFVKKKRVKKIITQPAPQSLHKHKAEDVNIIDAEDALEAEQVGIVSTKKQRGKSGNSAYFARAGGGILSSAHVRQTEDGHMQFRKKR
ncbi:hypothetical protein DE146DRAFT_779676 [Phaeosphaeria sp. MPI-PUGE-AT-0046c]|nr:hypothetical protein DE146DRAFT_779676 [Phaeosphaeria sp. MPI-PUGE-AT-0046c]